MATDGTYVYVSDMEAGKVYRLGAEGVQEIKAPPGVNGLTFADGRMYAVSWTLHDIYQLDPTGKGEPVALGLAGHFKALDGIEVLADGTLLVSDFEGHRVAAVAPDRKTVYTLAGARTPADIGLDRDRMLLYVPMLEANRVATYKLEHR